MALPLACWNIDYTLYSADDNSVKRAGLAHRHKFALSRPAAKKTLV
jgi:hypothetical protein